MKHLILLTGIVLTLVACKKDEEVETPVTATIDITSLHEGDSINYMDMAMVHGSIAGTGEMHGYRVVIKNMSLDSVVYDIEADIHASSYSVAEHWMNNVPATSNMKATVSVALDDNGTLGTKEVNFVCKGM